MAQRGASATLRREVEAEIKDHANWCSPNCQTFLSEEYREKRIVQGISKEDLQENYDSCHIWR